MKSCLQKKVKQRLFVKIVKVTIGMSNFLDERSLPNQPLKFQIISKTFQSLFLKIIPFLKFHKFQQVANQILPSLPALTFFDLQKEHQLKKLALKHKDAYSENPIESATSFQTKSSTRQNSKEWFKDSPTSIHITQEISLVGEKIPQIFNKSLDCNLLMKHVHLKALIFERCLHLLNQY